MSGRARASVWVLGVAAVLAGATGCGVLSPDPVEPATQLPVLVRFVHGHGSEDLVSVGSDGAVTGWLGGQDGDRPVGCLAEASFVRGLAQAAADDLEPGATEPGREGADFERMEVTGRGGTAWLADGGNSEVVRLALSLVGEVHRAAADQALCRATPDTSTGDLAKGVVVNRWSGPNRFQDHVFVSTTGAVTGRTRDAVVSCEVPEATARGLATGAVPEVVPRDGAGDIVQLSLGRGDVDHPLAPTGADPLTTAALALLDDLQAPPAERALCTARS